MQEKFWFDWLKAQYKKISTGYREIPGTNQKEERFLTKMVGFDYEKC